MSWIGPETLGELFDEHAAALVLYARQWCPAPEDVVQDAFLSLAKQRVRPDQVLPWLYRVVRNGALAANRTDGRRHRREAAVSSRGEVWFAAGDDRIDARHAEALLRELEPEVRAVVVARIWGGLTFDAIAQVQGCSLTTAHRRYRAGLAQLLERLETHEPRRRSCRR